MGFGMAATKRLAALSAVCVGVFCALVVAGCDQSPASLPPADSVIRFDAYESECLLSPERCAVLLTAIELLEGHSDVICRQSADKARARYFGDTGGYMADSGTLYDMFVKMKNGTGWSGRVAEDKYVRVEERLWTKLAGNHISVGTIAGLIAHEEMHHDGWDHDLPGHNSLINHRQTSCTV